MCTTKNEMMWHLPPDLGKLLRSLISRTEETTLEIKNARKYDWDINEISCSGLESVLREINGTPR